MRKILKEVVVSGSQAMAVFRLPKMSCFQRKSNPMAQGQVLFRHSQFLSSRAEIVILPEITYPW